MKCCVSFIVCRVNVEVLLANEVNDRRRFISLCCYMKYVCAIYIGYRVRCLHLINQNSYQLHVAVIRSEMNCSEPLVCW